MEKIVPAFFAFDCPVASRYSDSMGKLTESEIQEAFSAFGLGLESERQQYRRLASLDAIGRVPEASHAEFLRIELTTDTPDDRLDEKK